MQQSNALVPIFHMTIIHKLQESFGVHRSFPLTCLTLAARSASYSSRSRLSPSSAAPLPSSQSSPALSAPQPHSTPSQLSSPLSTTPARQPPAPHSSSSDGATCRPPRPHLAHCLVQSPTAGDVTHPGRDVTPAAAPSVGAGRSMGTTSPTRRGGGAAGAVL